MQQPSKIYAANEQIQAPYGKWISPITPEMTTKTGKSNRNCHIQISGDFIFWTESRPSEKGRNVIMCRYPNGTLQTVTPPDYDVRSKVHEYGGLAYTIHDELIYFVNAKDQCIYVQKINQEPTPLTQPGIRFADLHWTKHGLLAIAEKHTDDKVVNFLALISLGDGCVSILDQGQDFYAAPSLSHDGFKIAWITWNNPHMPWDETSLWIADFTTNSLENKLKIASQPNESIQSPQWSPKGKLFYVSDKSGWWNLYRYHDETSENIHSKAAEFGDPLWQLGNYTWRFTARDEEIICIYYEQGTSKIALLNPETKDLKEIALDYTDFSQLHVHQNHAIFLTGSPTHKRRIAALDLTTLKTNFIDNDEIQTIGDHFLSHPQFIEFPSANGRKAYGYFYLPKNINYKPVMGSLPPLMVLSHGGPTASADPIFNLRIQYWTSRGWAVLDVNYGGSTGYGRAYRDSLKGQWGIVDVEDCAHGALYLASAGKVDPKRKVIRGGSAGGFTTLAALAFSDVFCAGASYYGVADLELLAKETHKFEAHYLDSLIGPYPAMQHVYYQRSPLHHADKISCPVIFFQGGQDKIVPPNQTIAMFQALKNRGLKTELIIYENEEHGFRSSENIYDAFEKEQRFYDEVFSELNL